MFLQLFILKELGLSLCNIFYNIFVELVYCKSATKLYNKTIIIFYNDQPDLH